MLCAVRSLRCALSCALGWQGGVGVTIPDSIVLSDVRWSIGSPVGDPGGFGQVFAASDGSRDAVVKFVAKAPGADREMLLANLDGARNVVPVWDSGEYAEHWVLVMPRASYSLRQRLRDVAGRMTTADTLHVLADVADALVDLAGRVVHRDIKPENILLLDGRWCLADFGIARYAEATTAASTHQGRWTPHYAAPEQWSFERATSATDVYALGVVAYELITGALPFAGPAVEDFREQHLRDAPADLADTPAALAGLIIECLFKAPAARPSAANLAARLEAVSTPVPSAGLSALRNVGLGLTLARAADDRNAARERSAAEERGQLADAAAQLYSRISGQLRHAVETQLTGLAPAPSSGLERWTVTAGVGRLRMGAFARIEASAAKRLPFVVVACGTVSVEQPTNRHGYAGRSHSLWFGDVQATGEYRWFETAFMTTPYPFTQAVSPSEPFALDPGANSVPAILPGQASIQLAWPFTLVEPDRLEEFIDRWAAWLAAATAGALQIPSPLPERDPANSWRP